MGNRPGVEAAFLTSLNDKLVTIHLAGGGVLGTASGTLRDWDDLGVVIEQKNGHQRFIYRRAIATIEEQVPRAAVAPVLGVLQAGKRRIVPLR